MCKSRPACGQLYAHKYIEGSSAYCAQNTEALITANYSYLNDYLLFLSVHQQNNIVYQLKGMHLTLSSNFTGTNRKYTASLAGVNVRVLWGGKTIKE